MTIKITSEEELKEVAAELLHVMVNLRHYTKWWQEQHGSDLLDKKKHYEKMADDLLLRLKIQYEPHRHANEIKIETTHDSNPNSTAG